ncbi:aminoglycoside phosphotransferase family protein [Nocardia sp. BMG111209]|uniref:aminoglycoside phosphotransferase family protein n=1 Tax=Nocardia sp. BMG111209 TaxID=1160137 RepID=UPI000369CB11|nr:aminoglycoside phosphotransferase family protein [Nocardia sp. BMG111209]
MIEIPAEFIRIKSANAGERGLAWTATLPGLLDELLQRWSCTPTGPVMYGRVGIVVPVRNPDLPPAVVKVSFPHPGNVHDPDAYVTWAGNGAVRLFARDDDNFAMLLERVSQHTLATVTDHEEALTIQGGLSRRLAVAAPPGLPRLAAKVDRWEHEILSTATAFGDPVPRVVLDAAVATLRELGPGQPDILVHGDLHDANILAADREPWLAIDPATLVGDPAHDALNVIRSPRFGEVLLSSEMRPDILRFLGIYCAAAGLDPEHARRWTQAGAVREAMWGRRHGEPDWLVHATDRLAEALL